MWPIAETVLAVADALEGRLDLSIGRLRAALAATGVFPLSESAREAVGSLLAIALFAVGETAEARALTRTLTGAGVSAMGRALDALAAGDAVSAILAATSGLGSDRTIRVRATLLLVRAAAAARRGRVIAARRDASIAFDLFNDHGVRIPWLILPADDRRAVLALLADTDELAGDLLAELAALPVLVRDVGPAPRLTARERTVLAGVFARETNADIAARLGVSPNTVKKQRASLYRKLGVSSWEDAVHAALEHGLLDHEP